MISLSRMIIWLFQYDFRTEMPSACLFQVMITCVFMCLSICVAFKVFAYDKHVFIYIYIYMYIIHFIHDSMIIYFECILDFAILRFWKHHFEVNSWVIVNHSAIKVTPLTLNWNEIYAFDIFQCIDSDACIAPHFPCASCQVMADLYPINSKICIVGRLFEKCWTPSD